MTRISIKLTKRNKQILGALLLVAVVSFMFYSSQTAQLGIVTPGWEIYNQISAMNIDGFGLKTSALQFTSPRDISAPYWKVDVDDPNCGVPTIQVQTSELRHVDFMGNSQPMGEPAKTRTVVRNNHTYILDYHIYMFDVTIRTVADFAPDGHTTPFGSYVTWKHETSWPYIGDDGIAQTAGPVTDLTKSGKQFSGNVYTKFVISPWSGVPSVDAPTNTTVAGAWSGVMNSYIYQKEQGQVANQWGMAIPDGSAQMFVRGGLDNGAQVPMFADDGYYGHASQVVDWDTQVTPDTRIASTVVLGLPVQEAAGADLTLDWLNGVTAIVPCDVYVKYTIRVDVLTTHDFVLQTAESPPTLAPPNDFISWSLGFWEGIGDWFADTFGNPFSLTYMMLVLVLVVVGIVTVTNPGLWNAILRRKKHE